MSPYSFVRHCLCAALCLLTPLVSVAQDWRGDGHERLLHFGVHGSKATYPLAINEAGTVTGYYLTGSDLTKGFVRDRDGLITTFDVPGSSLTEPVSINAAGEITGFFEVSSGTPGYPAAEGFVRRINGKIITFGDTTTFSAQPVAINADALVVGNFPDVAYAGVVFIRHANGSIGGFSLSHGASYSTFVTGLNDGGQIVGYTNSESLDESEGFLIDTNAPLPNLDDETGVTFISVSGSTGTFPTAINAWETVVGCYLVNNIYHYFVRYHDGVIETLKVPGTVPSCLPGFSTPGVFNVNPTSITINNEGIIVGYYVNKDKVRRGFVRFDEGRGVTFGDPESTQTIPTGINNRGVIVGYDFTGSVTRGFIREP